MIPLNPEVVAAMWLYGDEYSRQPLSAKDWYRSLPESRKATISRFVYDMDAALKFSPLPPRETVRSVGSTQGGGDE